MLPAAPKAGLGRMLFLKLLEVADPPMQTAMLPDQPLSRFADLVDERVPCLLAAFARHRLSSHNMSGLTTIGDSSPRRRFITVICSTLFGFARCLMFQVNR